MKKLLAISILFSAAAFAETINGTLMDGMCKGKDPAEHPTKCAIACAKSGYGLMTSQGKYLRFDEAGNTKALAALKETDKEKDLKATVNGTVEGDMITVESVSID